MSSINHYLIAVEAQLGKSTTLLHPFNGLFPRITCEKKIIIG